MSRIRLHQSMHEIAEVMCEGNPGALNIIMMLMTPENFHWLLMCDTLELYGARLYMFAHDCCGDDLETTKRVLKEWQMGKISKAEIDEHIGEVDGYGKPFELSRQENGMVKEDDNG